MSCVPSSPETKLPTSIFHKAAGWWLSHEVLWPASLRRGFWGWELDPQRLTKLQLQRGYYRNIPIEIETLPFFFLFPEMSFFSGFLRRTFRSPPHSISPHPAFKKQTLSHNKSSNRTRVWCCHFPGLWLALGREGSRPALGEGWPSLSASGAPATAMLARTQAGGSQCCCSSELPFPSSAAHVRGVRNAAALWALSVGCPH